MDRRDFIGSAAALVAAAVVPAVAAPESSTRKGVGSLWTYVGGRKHGQTMEQGGNLKEVVVVHRIDAKTSYDERYKADADTRELRLVGALKDVKNIFDSGHDEWIIVTTQLRSLPAPPDALVPANVTRVWTCEGGLL